MSFSDPMSNALTKIRNASRAKHPTVEIPAARFTQRLLDILKQEGFIRTYKLAGQPPATFFRVYLKYAPDKTPAIAQMIRVSKPGQRRYAGAQRLPRVLGGLGRAILTTSHGLMTDHEARRKHLGGEIICYVW